MPKYNNSFREPEHEEHMIQDEKGELIGTIRIKPSSILWKDASQQKFSKVSLDDFRKWMLESGKKIGQ